MRIDVVAGMSSAMKEAVSRCDLHFVEVTVAHAQWSKQAGDVIQENPETSQGVEI